MYHSKIINFSPSDDLNKYLKKSSIIILDFLTTWCAQCKYLTSILHSAAEKYKFTLIMIDVDKNKKISQQYKISEIPHVYLYIDGELDLNFIGIDKNQLNHMIKIISSRYSFFRKENHDDLNKCYEHNKNKIFSSEDLGIDYIFNIKFKYNNLEFERRFVGNNTIGHIKTFLRNKIGHKNVYIFSIFPKKDYNDDNITINKSGIEKNQILFVSLV